MSVIIQATFVRTHGNRHLILCCCGSAMHTTWTESELGWGRPIRVVWCPPPPLSLILIHTYSVSSSPNLSLKPRRAEGPAGMQPSPCLLPLWPPPLGVNKKTTNIISRSPHNYGKIWMKHTDEYTETIILITNWDNISHCWGVCQCLAFKIATNWKL